MADIYRIDIEYRYFRQFTHKNPRKEGFLLDLINKKVLIAIEDRSAQRSQRPSTRLCVV